MPHDPHSELRRLFDRALDLPAAARMAFLDSKCGTDTQLKQRLVAMLLAAEGAAPAPALDRTGIPSPDLVPASAQLPPVEGPGTIIGPYKLLQQIGEGGFGAVFLAQQEHPVARKVALKIVKLGMDTRQVVARFEQERQALAMMDHPNIARVLDAGATETGRPYFVMDLVKGAPIVEYCDKANLAIHERLELFAQVCHAVQHAHGKGIIHRDIKPSNVLVSVQDGKPQAKVIDFGIAKATSSKLTEKTLFTEHQQIIGTLQYMSPEQAEGSLDIDTRTDIYSLGVILYELLTGSTPFDRKTLQNAAYGELQRMIREIEPPKPSTRLSDSHEALAAIAAHRRIEPRRLGALVRGELDWIVMKALEKDRTRRYETANGLAMDIRRYVAGEPVLAAPPSALYRIRKFVRRNRTLVTGGTAVAAALAIGVVAFAWQADVARSERDDAEVARQHEAEAHQRAEQLAAAEARQRKLAESNEHRADATNQFLTRMLGSANLRELGREAKVSQALAQAAATVEGSFPDEPEVEASLRGILGRTYVSLGMLEEAQPHLEREIDLNRRLHGETSVEFANSERTLADWKEQKGDAKAAAELFLHAFGIVEKQKGAEDPTTLMIRLDYANCLARLDRLPEAEKLLRETLATMTRTQGRDAANTQVAINSLAVLLHTAGRLEEAEALYREAFELGKHTLGPDHPDTLTAQVNLASVMLDRGDAACEPLMSAAYTSVKRIFGDGHPRTGGVAEMLARIYTAQGRYKDALPLLELGLANRMHAEGGRTRAVAKVTGDLARVKSALNEHAEAISLLRKVVELRTSLQGPEDAETIVAIQDLANALVRNHQTAEAEPMFQHLLEVCPRALGPDDPGTIITINSYAVMLLEQKRFADARPQLEKALEIGRRVQGAQHRNTLITQMNYIEDLRELGQLDEAADQGRTAITNFEAVFGKQHPYTATAHGSYAKTLSLQGQRDEARTHLVTAIAIRKAATGEANPTFAREALQLARLLADMGQPDQAEPVLLDLDAVYTKARGPNHVVVATARLELAHCRALQHRFAEAEPLFTESMPVLTNLLPDTREDVQRGQRYCADFYAAWNEASADPVRAAKAAEWHQKAEAQAK